MIGTTLSHYDITAELGRGGMGIVYRARDTKLDRDVAIKILPSAALASADDRERFYREAKSAAQLHHPNIASVFEIDEAVPSGGDAAEPRPFIAMEFIEGQTLHDIVKKGPLKLSDAVKIASQVAEALKAAHAKDIVHRDIKSANVMITEEGVAKVLDFGLAKTNQSTMLTRMGSTLGTVAYMSPEQARGQEVDGRTDLYSLGTMLYETVAGKLPFAGEYEQAVVYGILNESPEPLTAVRTGVPMQLEWIVNKLLAKDADYRYQTAGDLLADLKALDLSGSGMSRRSMPTVSAAALDAAPMKGTGKAWSVRTVAAVGVAALIVGLAAGVFYFRETEAPALEQASFHAELVVDDALFVANPSISSDGRYLAFIGESGDSPNGMLVKDLVSGEVNHYPGRNWGSRAAFSPDGRWIIWAAQSNAWKAPTGGGPAVAIGPNCFFPVFLDNERFVCEQDWDSRDTRGLHIRDIDGAPGVLSIRADTTDEGQGLAVTSIFPGGRFGVGMVESQGKEFLSVFDFEQGSVNSMPQEGVFPRYVSSGHLVYIDGSETTGILMARPFSLESREFTGPAAPVIDTQVNWRDFDVTASGLLVLASEVASAPRTELTWYDTNGNRIEALPVEPNDFDNPAISPDGRFVAVEIEAPQEEDTYIIDTETGTDYRWSFTGDGNNPAWSADGNYVYIASDAEGIEEGLLVKPADGSGVMELAYDDATLIDSPHVARNGSRITYRDIASGGIHIRSISNPDSVRKIVRGDDLFDPALSPDGNYVAFMSTEQESFEIFVQQSDGDASWLVSIPENENPGRPMWSPDGEWLYYRDANELWRSRVTFTPTFRRDRPERVLEVSGGGLDFDLHPDGERILINGLPGGVQTDSGGQARLSLRVNLMRYLNEIAPANE